MNHQDPLGLSALIAPAIESLGCSLWGVEYRQQENSALLRVFIEREGGVSLDDCSAVSQQLSAVLDVEDPIPVAYILEVSSPGVDRVLFVPEQFVQYIGESMKVRTRLAYEGRRNFIGKLVAADEDNIVVNVDGEEFTLAMDNIDRARLRTQVKPGKPGKKH